jgi:ATP-dependent Zn protease
MISRPNPATVRECRVALKRHRKLLERMADVLVEKETISGDEVLELLRQYDARLYERLGKSIVLS